MWSPAAASARTADSRPEPGPFTRTSTLFIPYWSRATPAAASEACCAAYGVALREPLKPIAPAGGRGSWRRSVWSAFARAFEADRARRRPAHHAAVRVRDGDLRIVERRRDMHVPVRNDATLALLLELFLALGCRCRLSRCSGIRRCSCDLWFFCHVSLQSFSPTSETLPS